MVEAYKKFWRNYTNFSGRSTVSDYWFVFLANVIIGFVIGFIDGLMGESAIQISNVVVIIYTIATLIPSLALSIRRLHDTNKSGWFLLLGLIPIVGQIILLVFYLSGSVNEGNKYGKIAE